MTLYWMIAAGCAGPDSTIVPLAHDSDDQATEEVGANPHAYFGPPRWLSATPPPLHAPPTDTGSDRPDTPKDPADDPSQADFLYEEGSIHDLRLALAQGARHDLELHPDTDVSGELTYGDQTWTVGVRLKGNMTLRGFDGKPSIKIDMHQFDSTQRFFGLRRLTLNNMVQDKSMLKEHVAYYFYRALGVPAPRHGYVRLWINDEWYGLYGVVESMDEQFIKQNWPHDNDGNLYEGGYGGDLGKGQAPLFAVQEEGTPAPYGDLERLIDALAKTTPTTYLGQLSVRFDFDPLLSALALDLLAGNWDGYARAANNFLLYHAPASNRWSLVPWGQDQAFTDANVDVHNGWKGKLVTLCGGSSDCKAMLDTQMAMVLDKWETLDIAGYARSTFAAIASDCLSDPRVEIPCIPDDVYSFLEERPVKARQELHLPAAR